MKCSCFCWILIILLAIQSVSAQNESIDKTAQNVSIEQLDSRTENLMKQVKELFEAYDKGDCARFVELSHPKVYEKHGPKKFFEEVQYVIVSMSEIYELLPTRVEIPNGFFEIDKQIFTVVPYKLNGISRMRKNKDISLGSMVGISEDGGKNWKFVKGVSFNEAFPNVAGMFLIPNPVEKRLEDNIEQ